MSFTPISVPIYIIFTLQFFLLPIQLFVYMCRQSDVRRKRFLVLVLTNIVFSSIWICLSFFHSSSEESLFIVELIGLLTILYSYFYWSKELGIAKIRTQLFWLLLHSALILLAFFISKLNHTNFEFWSTILLFTYAELISIFYIWKVVLHIKKLGDLKMEIQTYPILIASLASCLIPFGLTFFENKILIYVLLNFGFLVIAVFYLKAHVLENRREWSAYQKTIIIAEENQITQDSLELNSLMDAKRKMETLTVREFEVVELMAQRLMWKEISGRLDISESTARKHGANIYAKFNVSKLDDFLKIIELLSSSTEE